MNKQYITPAIIIHENHLKKIKLIDLDINNKTENSLNFIENQFKSIINSNKISKRFLQTIFKGDLFSFNVSIMFTIGKKNKHWNISVWDVNGNTSVSKKTFNIIDENNDTIPSDVYYEIIKNCNNYTNNIYRCNGCGVNMKKIAGRYFAGGYCEKCWNSKYRAIEANENYN